MLRIKKQKDYLFLISSIIRHFSVVISTQTIKSLERVGFVGVVAQESIVTGRPEQALLLSWGKKQESRTSHLRMQSQSEVRGKSAH